MSDKIIAIDTAIQEIFYGKTHTCLHCGNPTIETGISGHHLDCLLLINLINDGLQSGEITIDFEKFSRKEYLERLINGIVADGTRNN